MTRQRYALTTARWIGRCSACHGTISRGETITVLQAPSRTLCHRCGRAWRARDADADRRQADAAAIAKRSPSD